MERQNRRVASISTTFEIIEKFKQQGESGVTEIANSLNLPKSTVYYHLQTLSDMGYLVSNAGRYELSLRFLELGERIRQKQVVYEPGKPEVERLARETGTNGYLMVEQNDLGILLYMYKEKDINLGDTIGQTVCLTSTALGKAILAHLSQKRVKEILEHHGLPEMTPNTITSEESLFEELEQVRERGYAVSRGEQVVGLRAIGTPVMGPNDTVYGAISIAGPMQVMRGGRFENQLPEKVLSAANVVELKLIEKISDN